MLNDKIEKSTPYLLKILPGIMLCLLLAIPSWFLGNKFPVIGGPVIAILIGIIITTLFPFIINYSIFKDSKITFSDGIKYTSKKLLQYSIILLGFEMDLYRVIKVGGQSLLVMVFTLTCSFITAYLVGKALKLTSNTTILIGVGTSICGGSAIAATAPVIKADDEDVARAISTIFLFNILAVFIFPFLGHLLNMSDISFGMWAGTAINDTSSVLAAGTAWSNSTGTTTALEFATIVKLTRTLTIVPITLVLAILTAKKQKDSGNSDFKFSKVFPWFVIYFIVAAILKTFLNIPDEITIIFVRISKFVIIMAMAAIGLNTNLKKLLANGFKPILLGLCCWFVVAFVGLIVQQFIVF